MREIHHYRFFKEYVIRSICNVDPVLHFRKQKKENVSRETSSLSMSIILFRFDSLQNHQATISAESSLEYLVCVDTYMVSYQISESE